MAREDFVAYYKNNLQLSENDFNSLMKCLDTKLPQSFRIIESPFYSKVKEEIAKIPRIKKVDYLEDTYVFNKRAKDTKRNCKFIVNQTLLGTIQRQEIVSMIPVSLMGVEKTHYVLDLCAAPGSKTRQILSVVNKDGLVIANNQNKKRLYILLSQVLKNPHESLLVTQYNAIKFPRLNLSNGKKFDRVLCDVPCSSDGTIRKNPNVLTEWNLKKASDLFDIQYNILKRAVDLVETDGIIVYSTCSLNPLENECIIQNIVINEDLIIIDPFTFIQENEKLKKFLKRRGLKNWKIEDFKHKKLIIEPTTLEIGLEKCIRIYPHDNNTGGFFVALLKKNSIGDKENNQSRNVYRASHIEVPVEEVKLIKKLYDNYDDINIVRRYNSNKSLYRVSKEIKFILFNNNARVIYAGYKLFEKEEKCESGVGVKNILYDGNVKVDETYDLSSLKEALGNMKLESSSDKKPLIINIKDFNVNLVGYLQDETLNIDTNDVLKKGLLDFI